MPKSCWVCLHFVVVRNDDEAGNNKKNNDNKSHSRAQQSTTPNKDHMVAHSEKMVKLVCSSTDYKEKCEGPLNKAMEDDPKLTQPKDLLKAYVKFAEDEVSKAFNKTISMKFETEQEKGAFEDCKKLFEDAKDDIATSISELEKIEMKNLSQRTPDFNSWLSAVISFQQNCVDGFPEGNTKTELQTLFNDSKEFVSNSLAILSQVASTLSTIQTLAHDRSLLSHNSNSPVASLDKTDGLPSWMNHED